jgi:two-component system cell cycle sensor histidine kinase/response regulator CckA
MGGRHANTVLVVEADDDVRALVSRMLEAPDRHVLAAANAGEALELADSNEIDLLLTDVVLLGMSGLRIVKLMRSLLPGLPVLYMSGWFDHPEFPELDGETVLRKPFSLRELNRAVADALDGRSRLLK